MTFCVCGATLTISQRAAPPELTVVWQITAGSARVVPDLTKTAADVKMAQLGASINSLGAALGPARTGEFLFAAAVNIVSAH